MGPKLGVLEKMIGRYGTVPGMKDQMLSGARAGMLRRLKTLRKKKQEVTREALMVEITDKFLELMGRVGITRKDFENMADNILVDIKKGKL